MSTRAARAVDGGLYWYGSKSGPIDIERVSSDGDEYIAVNRFG